MEDKQNLTEQQKILLSKLETLRAEMHVRWTRVWTGASSAS